MSHSCCHCLTASPSDALPDGWRSFTTHDGAVLTLCRDCRLKWVEDFMGSVVGRVAALEAAMITVCDIMRTDVPESLPYRVQGKGIVN